ncbi:MAG: hypothetical protein KBC26_01710 [Candidatus Pacebacteria bacterium]|nr:hypothetical protein [Candidatus Paceibacterota bacterium]
MGTIIHFNHNRRIRRRSRARISRVHKTFTFKKPKFETLYFLVMMFLSGIVGLLAAVVVKEAGIDFDGLKEFSPAIAFIVGYAGGDLLENIYKIILKKPSLYETTTIVQK